MHLLVYSKGQTDVSDPTKMGHVAALPLSRGRAELKGGEKMHRLTQRAKQKSYVIYRARC